MGFRPRRPAAWPLLLAFLVATLLISHNRNRRASESLDSVRFCACVSAIDIGGKNIFYELLSRLTNPI